MSECLLLKIKSGVSNSKVVLFPGTEQKIRLRVLSNLDTLDAALDTDALYSARKISVSFHNVDDYNMEKDTQRLFRACLDPDTGDRIAPTITEFRGLLTDPERVELIAMYNALVVETSPSPQEMSQVEWDALVEDLKKKPQETIGNISSITTLKKLCSYMANQLVNLAKDSGPTST